jgi:uncharacterized protein
VTPEQRDLVRHRLARAAEALDEARLLLDTGHTNTCVNRLYYACFYAVTALLLTEGRASAKHSGVRALFDGHWVKPGRVPVDVARTYRRLFSRRQQGDYDDWVQFDVESVRKWMGDADGFVARITEVAQAAMMRNE